MSVGYILLGAGAFELTYPGALGRALRVIGEGIAEGARDAAAAKKLEIERAADLSYDPMSSLLAVQPLAPILPFQPRCFKCNGDANLVYMDMLGYVYCDECKPKGRTARAGTRAAVGRSLELKSVTGRVVAKERPLPPAPDAAPPPNKKGRGPDKKDLRIAVEKYLETHLNPTREETTAATLRASFLNVERVSEAGRKAHARKVYEILYKLNNRKPLKDKGA